MTDKVSDNIIQVSTFVLWAPLDDRNVNSLHSVLEATVLLLDSCFCLLASFPCSVGWNNRHATIRRSSTCSSNITMLDCYSLDFFRFVVRFLLLLCWRRDHCDKLSRLLSKFPPVVVFTGYSNAHTLLFTLETFFLSMTSNLGGRGKCRA